MNESRFIPELDDILAECLDDVLRGNRTIDDCLQRYPQFADELKPTLHVALLTSHLKSPELAADKVNALEARLRAKMPVQPRRKTLPFPFAISRMAAAIAIVLMLAFGSGAGLVAASSNSLPGDPLYGIKRLWEAIVLALATLTDQFDGFTLHLAEVRLDEVKRLDEQGQLDQTALVDLYSATVKAMSYADSASEQAALIEYMREAAESLKEVRASLEAALIYRDVVNLMTPVYRLDGSVQPPASDLPPSLNATVMPTATATWTATASQTYTPTPQSTNTDSPTATETPRPTNTSTPRIPPTPTRTPSPSPTITPTPTLTVTPTSTWTPLPIPGVPTLIAPTRVSPPPGGDGERTPVSGEISTVQVRETQQSVFLTQTAGPPGATSTSTPP